MNDPKIPISVYISLESFSHIFSGPIHLQSKWWCSRTSTVQTQTRADDFGARNGRASAAQHVKSGAKECKKGDWLHQPVCNTWIYVLRIWDYLQSQEQRRQPWSYSIQLGTQRSMKARDTSEIAEAETCQGCCVSSQEEIYQIRRPKFASRDTSKLLTLIPACEVLWPWSLSLFTHLHYSSLLRAESECADTKGLHTTLQNFRGTSVLQ